MKSYRHLGGAHPLVGEPIYSFIARVAERCPDNEAVVSVFQNRRLSYGALMKEVDALAKGLMALGIEKGDRVGIWSPNNLEWLMLQVATARIGAILVNINPAYRVGELAHVLTAARLQVVFLIPEFKKSHYVTMMREVCPEVESCAPDAFSCAKFPELKRLVVYEPEDATATTRPTSGFTVWNEVIEAGRDIETEALETRSASLDRDDPINIQFTSGTTGFAKPVVLTHHNILNNAYFVSGIMGLTEADRLCVPVPFYHCFGMVLANLACLCRGATVVIPAPAFEAEAVLRAVETERCTALHGVPTMFVAELEMGDLSGYDLSSLRTGIMAGAPCPAPLMTHVIEDLGCREILIAYGQTEASPVTHITRPDDSFDRRINTVGTNLPHQEVKIIDPQSGETVPINTPGEVCFRGYHVMQGYFEMPAATAETIDEHGWLHSGDLGVMDEDGYVRITGRLKDMIIRGGENIYPAEIEAYLSNHPDVAQVAVFGIPDEKWGEEVGAWVQVHEGSEVTADELIAYAKHGLAYFKVPRRLDLVAAFPMTVTGKIRKIEIREIVAKQMAATDTVPC